MPTDPSTQPDRVFRFGPFELSERDSELRKNGVRTKLQEQPFLVLVELASNAGRIVTREDLQQKLWPADTFVDFDVGLNSVVRKLRQALGDDADSPQYIETIAKRGYRFIAPVSETSAVAAPNVPSPAVDAVLVPGGGNGTVPPDSGRSVATATPKRRSRWYWATAATGALALVIYGAVTLAPRPEKPPLAVEQRVTANPPEAPVVGAAVSPDGKYVAYADTTGLYVRLIGNGETRQLALPKDLHAVPLGWFPDSTHLLLGTGQSWVGGGRIVPQGGPSLWKLSLLGGDPQKLAVNALAGAVSPDGSKIAFVRGNFAEIWVMESDGTGARRMGAPEAPDDNRGSLAWSPRGDRLAYVRDSQPSLPNELYDKERYSIETLALGGGEPTVVMRSAQPLWGLCWAPDGRLFYSSRDDSAHQWTDDAIWSVRVGEKNGEKLSDPVQISQGLGHVGSLSITADGKRLVLWRDNVIPTIFLSDIDSRTGQFTTPRRLTLDQNSNFVTTWTPDSRAVVFSSNRNGSFKLFRQAIDQSVADVLVEGKTIFQPRLTPDGSEILYVVGYAAVDFNRPVRLKAVPVGGGPQRDVLQIPRIADIQCARSPSQLCLLATYSPIQVYSFDPKTGKMELFAPLKDLPWTHWGISPDGSQVALASMSGEQRKITFVNLNDGSKREVAVGTRPIYGMDWAADSKGVYLVTANADGSSALEKISPSGERQELLTRDSGTWYSYAIPSPDGHHAALTVYTGENNVWMIENF